MSKSYTESDFGLENSEIAPNGVGFVRQEVLEGRMTVDEIRQDVENYLDEELSEEARDALRDMLRS